MNIELINTGSELLLGNVLNTHLAYLGARLFPLRIARQATVPDGPAIRVAMEEAFPRCDILLVTGGLGPTTDDVTREIVAELLGLPLRPNAEVRRRIEERLARLGSPLQERTLRQTLVPEGAEVLPNEQGTAPGLYLPAGPQRPHILLLPGPPQELKPMFENRGIALLMRLNAGFRNVEQRIFRVVGMGESTVEERIGLELALDGRLEIGYCARPNEVDFRLIGPTTVLEEATPQVYEALGSHIISEKGESLEKVVVERLRKLGRTLTVAESCTGGLLANRITNVPGSSEIFPEGFVLYSNHAKSERLGIPESLLELHGAVSEAVAREMAERALRLSNAHYALSLTGVAGPDGGSPTTPVGTVFIGLASQKQPTEVRKKLFFADRETFKQLATQTALDMLRYSLVPPWLHRGYA